MQVDQFGQGERSPSMFQLQEHCCASGYKIGIFLDDYYLEKEYHEYMCGRNAFRGDFSRTKIINCQ